MKKLFLFMVFSISFGDVFAQIDSLSKLNTANKIDLRGKNDFQINLIGVGVGTPEISFERLLKQKKGIGLAVFVAPEKDSEYNFGFIPYFRWYLGKPKALMAFIEGNMAAIYGEGNQFSNDGSSYTVKDLWGIGMGGSVGVKVVQRKSLILEGFIGTGKALGGIHSFRIYQRVGLTIGKRF
jgi:hypothetical protein